MISRGTNSLAEAYSDLCKIDYHVQGTNIYVYKIYMPHLLFTVYFFSK